MEPTAKPIAPKQIRAICAPLVSAEGDWAKRVKGLGKLADAITKARFQARMTPQELGQALQDAKVAHPLRIQLKAKRSAVQKATLVTVGTIATATGEEFDALGCRLLPEILDLTNQALPKVISGNASSLLRDIASVSHGRLIEGVVGRAADEKDWMVRKACALYMETALKEWSPEHMEPFREHVRSYICKGLGDAKTEVRKEVRKVFMQFWRTWRAEGDEVLASQAPSVQKQLKKEFAELAPRSSVANACACCSPHAKPSGASRQQTLSRRSQAVRQSLGLDAEGAQTAVPPSPAKGGAGGAPKDPAAALDFGSSANAEDAEEGGLGGIQDVGMLASINVSESLMLDSDIADELPTGELAATAALPSPGKHMVNESNVLGRAELVGICNVLATVDSAWEDRVNALEHIREMAAHAQSAASVTAPDMVKRLSVLKKPIQIQLRDLRAGVIKQTCATISLLAELLGSSFDNMTKCWLPLLLDNNSKAVTTIMSGAALACVKSVAVNCRSGSGMTVVIARFSQDRDWNVRKTCAEYVLSALESWSEDELAPFNTEGACAADGWAQAVLPIFISKLLIDKSDKVRAVSRQVLRAYCALYQADAQRLVQSLDGQRLRSSLTRDIPGLGAPLEESATNISVSSFAGDGEATGTIDLSKWIATDGIGAPPPESAAAAAPAAQPSSRIASVLGSKDSTIEQRRQAISDMKNLVDGPTDAQARQECCDRLEPYTAQLAACLCDRRVPVAKEACLTVATIADTLQGEFDQTASLLVSALLDSVSKTKPAQIRECSTCCMQVVFEHCRDLSLQVVLERFATELDWMIRKTCAEQLLEMMQSRAVDDKFKEQVASVVTATVEDASGEVRPVGRKLFMAFWRKWRDEGARLLEEQSSASRKQLMLEFPEIEQRVNAACTAPCCSPARKFAQPSPAPMVANADLPEPTPPRSAAPAARTFSTPSVAVQAAAVAAATTPAAASPVPKALFASPQEALAGDCSPASETGEFCTPPQEMQASPQKEPTSVKQPEAPPSPEPEPEPAAKAAAEPTPEPTPEPVAGPAAEQPASPIRAAAATRIHSWLSKVGLEGHAGAFISAELDEANLILLAAQPAEEVSAELLQIGVADEADRKMLLGEMQRLAEATAASKHLVAEDGVVCVDNLVSMLQTHDAPWQQRLQALEHIREIVAHSGLNAEALLLKLSPLLQPLCHQTTDLRSALVNEVCRVMATIAAASGDLFGEWATAVFKPLAVLTTTARREGGNGTSALACLSDVAKSCRHGELLSAAVACSGAVDFNVRKTCVDFVLAIAQTWDKEQLEPCTAELSGFIAKTLSDKNDEVRVQARVLFRQFWGVWQLEADAMVPKFTRATRNALAKAFPELKCGEQKPKRASGGVAAFRRQQIELKRKAEAAQLLSTTDAVDAVDAADAVDVVVVAAKPPPEAVQVQVQVQPVEDTAAKLAEQQAKAEADAAEAKAAEQQAQAMATAEAAAKLVEEQTNVVEEQANAEADAETDTAAAKLALAEDGAAKHAKAEADAAAAKAAEQQANDVAEAAAKLAEQHAKPEPEPAPAPAPAPAQAAEAPATAADKTSWLTTAAPAAAAAEAEATVDLSKWIPSVPKPQDPEAAPPAAAAPPAKAAAPAAAPAPKPAATQPRSATGSSPARIAAAAPVLRRPGSATGLAGNLARLAQYKAQADAMSAEQRQALALELTQGRSVVAAATPCAGSSVDVEDELATLANRQALHSRNSQ